MKVKTAVGYGIISTFIAFQVWGAGPTGFSNVGSILNTRHNLMQSTIASGSAGGSGGGGAMDGTRNNYEEVCVYCHTPHAANMANGLNAPLWNRSLRLNNYQTYNQLGTATLTQTVSAPGSNSLTCLSCHDGTTAVDAVINMPSRKVISGVQAGLDQATTFKNTGYNANMYTLPGVIPGVPTSSQPNAAQINAAAVAQETFLNAWDHKTNAGPTSHNGINSNTKTGSNPNTRYIAGPDPLGQNVGCMSCHSIDGSQANTNIADFGFFWIGTDLRNDHPVGITFPLTGSVAAEFNQPVNIPGKPRFFDVSSDGKMQKNEVRLYDTGGGPEVECASCHDPHGVPTNMNAPTTSPFISAFLRVNNSQGSALCLTCHIK